MERASTYRTRGIVASLSAPLVTAAVATLVLASLALAGCGEDPIGAGGCGLGTERDCTCEDGATGIQVCGASGVFGSCSCEADADVGASDLPGSDGTLDSSGDDTGQADAVDAADASSDAPVEDADADDDASSDVTQGDVDDASEGDDGDGGGALDLADAQDGARDLGDLDDVTSADLSDGRSGADPDLTGSDDPDLTGSDDPDALVSRDPDVVTHDDPDLVSSDDPDLFASSDPDLISDDPDLPGPDIFGRDLGPNGPPVPDEGEVALWFDNLFVEGDTALVSVVMNNPVQVYGAQFTVTGVTLVGHPFEGRGATARWTMRGNSDTGTVIAFSGSLTPIDPDNGLLFILRVQWPPDYARIDFAEDQPLLLSDAVGNAIPVVTNGYTFPWP